MITLDKTKAILIVATLILQTKLLFGQSGSPTDSDMSTFTECPNTNSRCEELSKQVVNCQYCVSEGYTSIVIQTSIDTQTTCNLYIINAEDKNNMESTNCPKKSSQNIFCSQTSSYSPTSSSSSTDSSNTEIVSPNQTVFSTQGTGSSNPTGSPNQTGRCMDNQSTTALWVVIGLLIALQGVTVTGWCLYCVVIRRKEDIRSQRIRSTRNRIAVRSGMYSVTPLGQYMATPSQPNLHSPNNTVTEIDNNTDSTYDVIGLHNYQETEHSTAAREEVTKKEADDEFYNAEKHTYAVVNLSMKGRAGERENTEDSCNEGTLTDAPVDSNLVVTSPAITLSFNMREEGGTSPDHIIGIGKVVSPDDNPGWDKDGFNHTGEHIYSVVDDSLMEKPHSEEVDGPQ